VYQVYADAGSHQRRATHVVMLTPLILVASCCSAVVGDVEVFVSVDGNDSNDGSSPQSALSTLERARQVVESKKEGRPAAVHVGAGTYYLPEPLVLTAAGSGTSWVGAGAGSTIIRGGKAVTGWQQHKLPHLPDQPLWRARNPFPGTAVYQLVEGRAPATLARHPNRGAGWLYNWSSTKVAGRPGIRWARATGLPLHFEMAHASAYVWHPYGYSEITGLANATFLPDGGGEVALYPTPHTMLVKAHFEGSLQFLDAPGEWALGEDGYIYLWPSQPLQSAEQMPVVSAALAPRLFDIRGQSTAAADIVRDVTIANMSLIGSGWLRNFECEWADRMNSQPARDPTGQWAFTREGMVRAENASGVRVVGCELLSAGTSSVWLEHYAQNCSVESNWIEHASFTGVHINGWVRTKPRLFLFTTRTNPTFARAVGTGHRQRPHTWRIQLHFASAGRCLVRPRDSQQPHHPDGAARHIRRRDLHPPGPRRAGGVQRDFVVAAQPDLDLWLPAAHSLDHVRREG
jgi:hypothetical protein